MIHDIELDGPAFLIVQPPPRRRRWISIRGLLPLVFVLGGFFCLGLILIPWPTRCDWEAARRAQCLNNLKQIALAIESYQQAYGVLPPAYLTDASGRRMHSWRVLILPFLGPEGLSLYEKYDFREPWDGPHNRRLFAEVPGFFRCPSPRLPRPMHTTNYVAITGPGAMFPGPASVRLAEIIDGPADTLMLAETLKVNVPWTAPIDLDIRTMSLHINDSERSSISSLHGEGANVAFGDAQRAIPEGQHRRVGVAFLDHDRGP